MAVVAVGTSMNNVRFTKNIAAPEPSTELQDLFAAPEPSTEL